MCCQKETQNEFYEVFYTYTHLKHSIRFMGSSQPAKLQKKQCGGVYFSVYGTAFLMPIQQKLSPSVLLFSDVAGWDGYRKGLVFIWIIKNK